jgi:Tol biopolymer transport system component
LTIKKTDITLYKNISVESNIFNPYSLNITNPYIVSGYRGWYQPGLFQSAFFPTFMISVPRKPDPEPVPPPENLFPDDIELPKQLTFSERDSKPFWSPDGNHIAFLSQRNTYNPNFSAIRFELWVMEKDDSNQRPIVSVDDLEEGSRFLHSRVSWAKNSNELLVSVYNGNTGEIWSVSIDGNMSRLPTTDDWAGFALYSFDGTKMAFVVQEMDPNFHGPIGRLYIANSDYSEHIFIDKGVLYDFSWKRDSQELIYSSKNDLWKYSISENKKTQFSKTPEDE